jgi:hypothetical protein
MIYARVSQSKIGMDMLLLQGKLDENQKDALADNTKFRDR